MRGLLRYLLIATVPVVLCVAAIATWWLRQPHRPLTIKSVPVTMAPRPGAPGGKIGQGTSGFLADAPWALSTLPECVFQVSLSTGPLAYVRARIPAAARELVPPASLVYRDCRLRITASGIVVHRGADTLRVPAPVRVFAIGSRLLVMHLEGPRAQLRTYVPSKL